MWGDGRERIFLFNYITWIVCKNCLWLAKKQKGNHANVLNVAVSVTKMICHCSQ